MEGALSVLESWIENEVQKKKIEDSSCPLGAYNLLSSAKFTYTYKILFKIHKTTSKCVQIDIALAIYNRAEGV